MKMDDMDAKRGKTDQAHNHENQNMRRTGSNEHNAHTSNDRRDPSKKRPSPNDKSNTKAGGGTRGPSPGTGKNLPDG